MIPALRSGVGRGQPREAGERAETVRLGEERLLGGADRIHHRLVAAGDRSASSTRPSCS